eukprot:SAG11_NODE_35665_length_265_cov_1.246988_1_plen_52_part_10
MFSHFNLSGDAMHIFYAMHIEAMTTDAHYPRPLYRYPETFRRGKILTLLYAF